MSDQGAPRTEPVVSVIILALNASALISEQSPALAAQDADFFCDTDGRVDGLVTTRPHRRPRRRASPQ